MRLEANTPPSESNICVETNSNCWWEQKPNLWKRNPIAETKPDFIVGTKPVCRNKTRLYCGKKPVCGNKTRPYCGNKAQLRKQNPTCTKLLLSEMNSERTSFSEAFIVWHERIYSGVTLQKYQQWYYIANNTICVVVIVLLCLCPNCGVHVSLRI